MARQRIDACGLQDRIDLRLEDYRKLDGQYDKIVSVEMIEAIGKSQFQTFWNRCGELLRPGGRLALQSITIQDHRFEAASREVDFIKRYIFPGGCLPSVAVIAQHLASDTDMQMVHLRDITQDYAITLAHWRERFLAQLQEVRSMGFSDEFIRMWEYYLAYCEGGFRERVIGTVQLAFAKPAYRFAAPGPEI